MNSKTDEQLMEIFQNDEAGQGSHAFDQLYRRYAKPMVNYFYYALRNDNGKAQDLLQDLFLKIIENKEKYDCTRAFKPWIYRLAINLCNTEYRSQAIHRKYEEHVKSDQPAVLNDQEEEHGLRAYINALNPDQRALIILRFKFRLSIREIGNIFELAEGTIKSRLFYATKELSKIYKKQNHDI